MKRSTGRLAVLCSLVAGFLAQGPLAHAGQCKRIRAEINLTTGTIEGNFGLDGTVVFVEDGSGAPPDTAPPGSTVFSGILTIATDHGAIELRETGMFSSRAGSPDGPILASWGEALTGTGRYAGVSGDLFFAGLFVGGAFLIDVTGQLCR